jgi:hypothetical protein
LQPGVSLVPAEEGGEHEGTAFNEEADGVFGECAVVAEEGDIHVEGGEEELALMDEHIVPGRSDGFPCVERVTVKVAKGEGDEVEILIEGDVVGVGEEEAINGMSLAFGDILELGAEPVLGLGLGGGCGGVKVLGGGVIGKQFFVEECGKDAVGADFNDEF